MLGILGWFGLALTQSGEGAEARALHEQFHSMTRQWLHLGPGEVDEAFARMDQAIDRRDSMMIPIKTYPFFDPLRADGGFTALLRVPIWWEFLIRLTCSQHRR